MAPDNLLPTLSKPLTEDAQRSYTLSAAYYTDPAIYEREKEAIFYKTWHCLGHLSQLERPGDYIAATIADQGVFVLRGKDGVLRGFYNVCQHRAHELLQGEGNVKAVITCPYHAWAYDLEGKLRTARNCESLPDFDKADFTLPQIAVEAFCGFVFVNLDERAASLASQAGDLAEDLRARIPYLDELKPVRAVCFGDSRMAAGWKVVVDNFLECYHCTPAHPAFADMIAMESYRMETFGLWSRQLGGDIKPDNEAYRIDPAENDQSAAFWYLWPTTTINLLPGHREVAMLSVRPHDHQSAAFVGQIYAPDGRIDEARLDYLNQVLGPEDQSLCESVQRGLRSKGYDQGRIVVDETRSGISEHAIHHFHRLVQQALGG